MLASGCGDAERLLHKSIRFIAIPVWTFVPTVCSIVVTPTRTFWSLASPGRVRRLRHAGTSTLALHFSVCQKASRHTTCTPRLSISPPSHAGFPFIPYEDGAGSDGLTLFLRKTSLDTGEETDATSLEENDSVRRGADVSVVRLHPPSQAKGNPRGDGWFKSQGRMG